MQWYKSKKFYRITFLITMTLLILYFIYILRNIFFPFIIGFLIAYLLNPMVLRLEQRKITRVSAILIIFLGVLSFFGVIGFFGFPKIIAELHQFAETIPVITTKIQVLVENAQQQYSRFTLPDSLRQVIDNRIARGENVLVGLVTYTVNSILNIFSHLFNLFLAPIVGFYILKDMEKIKKWIEASLPRSYRSDIMGLLRDMDDVIFNFIKGNFLVGIFVGLLTGAGMYLIGVPFALIIGVIAGITNLIPFLGPFIGAIPAVFFALLHSPLLALYAVLIIFIVQQIESNVLSPKILGDSVGLHPLWIIFSLLAGGQLMGILGMIIAVPVAAIVRVLVRFTFLKLVG